MRRATFLCNRPLSSSLIEGTWGWQCSSTIGNSSADSVASTTSSVQHQLVGASGSLAFPGVRLYCSPHPPGGLPIIGNHGSSNCSSQTQGSPTSASSPHHAPPVTQLATYHVVAPSSPWTPQRQPLSFHTFDGLPHSPLAPGHPAHSGVPQPDLKASMYTASLTPDVSAWTDGTTHEQGALQQLQQHLLKPPLQGFSASITWSATAIAAVTAISCAELLLLPGMPAGISVGTLVAEGIFSAAGQPSSLAGMLAASDGLEAVQAFSLARKLGQFALVAVIIRAVTGGKAAHLFRLKAASPLDKRHGWYWWGCLGLLGLGVVSAAHQGCAALLSLGLDNTAAFSSGASDSGPLSWFTGGDQRTLPYSCRWWAETVVMAPLLEETLFRGFLLASLTRHMSVGSALLTSSSVFALCHLGSCAVTDLPMLVGMGCVLGAVYLRSRNMLAPVAAHAAHNACAMIAASAVMP